MKKTILLAAMAACLFATNVFAQKIKGSDTCLPLTQTEAENFMNKNKAAKITVTGGGSGVGISALMEGTTDIAMASRKMKFDERMKLQEAGKKTKEEVIAYDALAVVVHPSNKVSNLTREQLEGIFTGKIKNWKEVGGADMKIVAYSRETSSGTYEFFKESVLKNKNYPVVRPLFYYYETKNASKVRPFIDYVMSAEGQATVKKVGYIPVK